MPFDGVAATAAERVGSLATGERLIPRLGRETTPTARPFPHLVSGSNGGYNTLCQGSCRMNRATA